jgi:hypothetical protein
VGSSAGLEAVERRTIFPSSGLELRPLGHLAHNQSLQRLCYPCSQHATVVLYNFKIISALRELHKTDQNIRSPGRDSNPESSEYETELLTTQP